MSKITSPAILCGISYNVVEDCPELVVFEEAQPMMWGSRDRIVMERKNNGHWYLRLRGNMNSVMAKHVWKAMEIVREAYGDHDNDVKAPKERPGSRTIFYVMGDVFCCAKEHRYIGHVGGGQSFCEAVITKLSDRLLHVVCSNLPVEQNIIKFYQNLRGNGWPTQGIWSGVWQDGMGKNVRGHRLDLTDGWQSSAREGGPGLLFKIEQGNQEFLTRLPAHPVVLSDGIARRYLRAAIKKVLAKTAV